LPMHHTARPPGATVELNYSSVQARGQQLTNRSAVTTRHEMRDPELRVVIIDQSGRGRLLDMSSSDPDPPCPLFTAVLRSM
jgi:hypothetical protein